MNPLLAQLQPYPFQRYRDLVADVTPADLPAIAMGMGEPRHPAPAFVVDALANRASLTRGLGSYPVTRGSDALRNAIAQWASARFRLPAGWLDPGRHVLPVNGTREGLFSAVQAIAGGAGDQPRRDLVLVPNPFYQIYEGAALLAGCQPWYMPERNGLPDLDAVPEHIWQRCRLLFICTPHNPTGKAFTEAALQQMLRLSQQHGFAVASDECYSELYLDEQAPTAGLLGACRGAGLDDFANCLVFHSLSKRSSLPGLRSGFVAGDAALIAPFLAYRTYHGCALPDHVQAASALAWQDEQHVVANRAAYRAKFATVLPMLQQVLEVEQPDGGFYLWPRTPNSDTTFACQVLAACNITLLPGSFLSRPDSLRGDNPGANRVRMALVDTADACTDAAGRLCRHLAGN